MPPIPSLHDQSHDRSFQSPPPKPNPKVLSLILKALIMTFITSLFFLFLGVAAILLCLAGGAIHRRRVNRSVQLPSSSDRLSPRDLRKFSQFRFSKGVIETESQSSYQSECVVCLDGFREAQWCRRLAGCNHVFHRRCVDNWLIKVPSCPICRTSVRISADTSSLTTAEEEIKQLWFR